MVIVVNCSIVFLYYVSGIQCNKTTALSNNSSSVHIPSIVYLLMQHTPYKDRMNGIIGFILITRLCIIVLVGDLLLWYKFQLYCAIWTLWRQLVLTAGYMWPYPHWDQIQTSTQPCMMTYIYSHAGDIEPIHFPASVETVNGPFTYQIVCELPCYNTLCLYTLFIFLHVTIMQSAGIRPWWACAMWSY